MKVVSGSLDVLETVGKKTFDVINEADPDLKGTRRLLSKQNRPTLSDVCLFVFFIYFSTKFSCIY